ncbi:hypothetical protein ATHSA_p10005 (plasmid) [Athalassotoga saccharophila]|uniref:Uncharacterized protein n=1 Tax=Athalassotoga saccharophila TaxID=1441386 RepID=A0A6N4TFU5_9BACT|nr:hypothetical protein ATHSA_p10005 [Athalassotoga saccharophila]
MCKARKPLLYIYFLIFIYISLHPYRYFSFSISPIGMYFAGKAVRPCQKSFKNPCAICIFWPYKILTKPYIPYVLSICSFSFSYIF